MSFRIAAISILLAVGLAGCRSDTAAPPPNPTPRSTGTAHHTLKTVFLIVLENHDWRAIVGNPAAPYINRTLLKTGAHATQYYNPPHNHPSLPNYLWLMAGTNFGIHSDELPTDIQFATHAHLTYLLDHAGISWRAYVQNINGRECPTISQYPYAAKHNPFVYFHDVTARAATCIAHMRAYTSLQSDLRHGRVARFDYILPDLCSDMHDSCAPTYNSIAEGDRFLATTIPPILRSTAFKHGGVIFITWDEGEGNDGPIGLIALSPDARRGYAGATHYTHSSTLRTIEEIFGVRPFLGAAAHSNDLRALFHRFP